MSTLSNSPSGGTVIGRWQASWPPRISGDGATLMTPRVNARVVDVVNATTRRLTSATPLKSSERRHALRIEPPDHETQRQRVQREQTGGGGGDGAAAQARRRHPDR